MLYTASIVHVLAALVELGAELQRKRLKDDYRNGRELCTTGLWGVVRRPHFACNVVHGAAYGVAAGGGWPFLVLPLGMYLGEVGWSLCPGVY